MEPTPSTVDSIVSKTSQAPISAAFLDIIGDLVEQWGFNRHTGSIWALLYLSNEPLNPRQIQDQLAMSAGSVNALLSELQTWGAIKRIRVAGDRNYYFEPQMPIWKPVTNVIRSRELRILGEAKQRLEQLQSDLKGSAKNQQNNVHIDKMAHVAALLALAATIGDLLVNAPIEKIEKITSFMKKLRHL